MPSLRELRLKKHWSQENLANLSGVSRSTIIAVEKGKRSIQPLTLQKLADALKVDTREVDTDDKAG
jgi:transcriptional regulator with XRE-family HTH domain